VVPYSITRDGDWKLIKRYEGQEFELYNLKEDLAEERDVSGEMPEKVAQLDQKLMKWLGQVNARMPKKNPEYISEK
jgi:arylsulfatase A